jgi:Tol biopolymer transport system component
VPLTAYAGSEGAPSLSPDGQFVAFDWSGTAQPPVRHIYIKDARGEALRQLTDSPASEHNPAWSPDGSRIAFIRARQGVFVISPLGGSERKICDTGTHVGWTSDSKSILIRDSPGAAENQPRPFGIFEVSLETGEKRQITQAPAGIGDWMFSVSPDGQKLAFGRFGLPGVGDVFVAPMSGGEARRVTNWSSSGMSVAWTPDGREIVYSVQEPQGGRLWRIPWNETAPGRGTPVAGPVGDVSFPSISRPASGQPARLAFQVEYLDVGLRLIDLNAVSGGSLTAVPLADSTRIETAARFSRDATKVAFASNRSGSKEIWVCNRDGSDLRQLTSIGGQNVLPCGWSPDGRKFLVQAAVNGNTDIYVVPASGGKPKKLTADPYFHSAPSWSRDGKWIYYASNRSARSGRQYAAQIWRMPAEGGEAIQTTSTGGFFQQESLDGKYLYFLDRPNGVVGITDIVTVMRMPLEGGDPVKILDGVRGVHWCVTRKGIYFVTRDSRSDSIQLYRFADAKVVAIGSLPFRVSGFGGGLVVSEDDRWLLTNQTNRNDTDLMLIDGFK